MADLSDEYLTTKELADLLRIKERKVYDLAASGAVPCTRAFGKLLFQRAAIDTWLSRHASGEEATPATLPSVFLGSHDPLLEWALRESGSGLATYFDGSLDGLERMSQGDGIASGLHIFDRETGGWNTNEVASRVAGKPLVLVEWAWRERGIIVADGNPKKISKIGDLKGLTVAPRQAQAGSQVLLEHLLSEATLADGGMTFAAAARTETDTALAVLEGAADAAFGLSCVAKQFRLAFVPIMRERFDLLVWRSEWFEEPFQTLLSFTRSDVFAEKAASLEGYDITGLGTVHYNGR